MQITGVANNDLSPYTSCLIVTAAREHGSPSPIPMQGEELHIKETPQWKIICGDMVARAGALSTEIFVDWSTVSASVGQVPAPTFHPFPNLPTELRRQIWHAALPDPRVLKFNIDSYYGDRLTVTGEAVSDLDLRLDSFEKSKVEVFSATCRESREVFLENYRRVNVFTVADGQQWSIDNNFRRTFHVNHIVSPPLSYVDFRRDILHINRSDMENLELNGVTPDFSGVERAAVANDTFTQDCVALQGFAPDFSSLKELTFIIGGADLEHDQPKDQRHLVEISDDLIDMTSQPPSFGNNPMIPDSSKLASLLEQAKSVRERVRSFREKQPQTWDDMDFRIAVLASRYIDPAPKNRELVRLTPRRPTDHDVSYYTYKPEESSPTYSVRIEELNCDAPCLPDGTPVGRYHGLEKLFEEAEN